MGKKNKQPCKNVISFRINDQERQVLDKRATESGLNVSAMMREVVKHMTVISREGHETLNKR